MEPIILSLLLHHFNKWNSTYVVFVGLNLATFTHPSTFSRLMWELLSFLTSTIPLTLQNRKEIKSNKGQVFQTAFTSPEFWIAQRFFTKELSFYIKMSDPPLSCKVPHRPIFLLMRLAVL